MERLVLFAHGSPDPRWRAPFERLADEVAAEAGRERVRLAYMESAEPTLFEALREIAVDPPPRPAPGAPPPGGGGRRGWRGGGGRPRPPPPGGGGGPPPRGGRRLELRDDQDEGDGELSHQEGEGENGNGVERGCFRPGSLLDHHPVYGAGAAPDYSTTSICVEAEISSSGTSS